MERKLASIQRIINKVPIEGADSIERVDVLGWHCVAKKDEYQVGDYVVYFEIDSIVPALPELEFMRTSNFRVKTRKFKGQVSQGLCMPITLLQEFSGEEGADVTELLGVKKWEPMDPSEPGAYLGGRVSDFPGFISKTDETRIQAEPKILYKYNGTVCYVTEKLDGSSFTSYKRDEEFNICSRRYIIKEDDRSAFWQQARKYQIKEILTSLGNNYCIQGELVGPGIQKNRLKLSEQDLYIFNVFDIDSQKYLSLQDMVYFCNHNKLKSVPIIDSNFILDHTVDRLVYYATRNSTFGEFPAEGVVIRPAQDRIFSFKVINPEYLLKHNL